MMGVMGWDQRPPESLEEAVGQAIGAGSVCWETPEGAGEFQSDRAAEIVDELVQWIRAGKPTVAEVRPLGMAAAGDAAAAALRHLQEENCWMTRVSVVIARRVDGADVETEYRWEIDRG